jgi:hypothetical protein
MTCDHCGKSDENLTEWFVLVNEMPFTTNEYEFCSLRCLKWWSVEMLK